MPLVSQIILQVVNNRGESREFRFTPLRKRRLGALGAGPPKPKEPKAAAVTGFARASDDEDDDDDGESDANDMLSI